MLAQRIVAFLGRFVRKATRALAAPRMGDDAAAQRCAALFVRELIEERYVPTVVRARRIELVAASVALDFAADADDARSAQCNFRTHYLPFAERLSADIVSMLAAHPTPVHSGAYDAHDDSDVVAPGVAPCRMHPHLLIVCRDYVESVIHSAVQQKFDSLEEWQRHAGEYDAHIDQIYFYLLTLLQELSQS